MTMPAALARMEALVRDAVSKGARLLVGGQRHVHSKWPNGYYFAPTVLADVTPAMAIAQEEVFGPVVVIMRFATDAEALEIVNACPYGLGASVFCGNRTRAERLVRGIRSGTGPSRARAAATQPGCAGPTVCATDRRRKFAPQACATSTTLPSTTCVNPCHLAGPRSLGSTASRAQRACAAIACSGYGRGGGGECRRAAAWAA